MSWEKQTKSSSAGRTLSYDAATMRTTIGEHVDTANGECQMEGMWSSDYSNTDEEDAIDDCTINDSSSVIMDGHYVALADYCAASKGEVSIKEGEIFQLLKVGCAGWWFVKVVGSSVEGWAPAAFLQAANRKNSKKISQDKFNHVR